LFAKIGRYVKTLPVIPVIGDGRQRFRPIYVGDLVTAILCCLESEKTVGRTYDLGGLDGVTFAQFIDGIGDAVGKRRKQLRLPIPLCLGLARVLALVVNNPPLTVDNIVGLTQMSECDISRAEEDFGFRPMTFTEGIGLLQQAGGI
jgi:NADH dehydrogenase